MSYQVFWVRGSLRTDDDARPVGSVEVINGHCVALALVNRDFLEKISQQNRKNAYPFLKGYKITPTAPPILPRIQQLLKIRRPVPSFSAAYEWSLYCCVSIQSKVAAIEGDIED
ncbi:MAG: hypothetical protein AB7G75_13710 [Candidatus Binatia bacterium]